MSRSTRSAHQRTGHWRPRLEVLESRRVPSIAVVAVSPPLAPATISPEGPGPAGGVPVEPSPSPTAGFPAGGVTIDPPPAFTTIPPTGGVTVDPPPARTTIPPVGSVTVDPPPAPTTSPPADSPGLLDVVAVDPPSGAHLATAPPLVTVTFTQ